MEKVIIVTTNDIPGYKVDEVYGEVFGLIVRSRNVFSNFGASIRTGAVGERLALQYPLYLERVALRVGCGERGADGRPRFDLVRTFEFEARDGGTAVRRRLAAPQFGHGIDGGEAAAIGQE